MYAELFNQEKFSLADDLFAADFVDHKFPPGISNRGLEAVRQLVIMFHKAFPDVSFYIDRDPLFAIPELYQIALDIWNGMPQRFPSVSFDEFVIMPDHVHCIIWLNKTQSEKPLTVGQVIGAYKSLVVVTWLNYIKEHDLNRSGKIWQRGFNDHIVRFGELEQKRQYIRNNPLKLKK